MKHLAGGRVRASVLMAGLLLLPLASCGESAPHGLSTGDQKKASMNVDRFRSLVSQGEYAECGKMIQIATDPALLSLYARNTAPGSSLPHPTLWLDCCERLKVLGTREAIRDLVALIEVPSDGESSYNWSMVVRDVGDEAVPYLEPYQEGPEGQRATMLINEIRKGTAGFGPEM